MRVAQLYLRRLLEETIAAEQAEVARYRALVSSSRRDREAERTTLQKQAQRVALELEEPENAIGLNIQGIAKHQLLFTGHLCNKSPFFLCVLLGILNLWLQAQHPKG